jgi:hypothetical protein
MKSIQKIKEEAEAATIRLMWCFALLFPEAVISAWVFIKLWEWFILPAFGLSCPSIPLAAGFCVILMFFRNPNFGYALDSKEATSLQRKSPFRIFVGCLLCPMVCLAKGWVIHLFL